MTKWLLLAAISALIAWTIWRFRRDGHVDAEAARALTQRRGIDVSEVRREVPTSHDRGQSWQLEEKRCTRYAFLLEDPTPV